MQNRRRTPPPPSPEMLAVFTLTPAKLFLWPLLRARVVNLGKINGLFYSLRDRGLAVSSSFNFLVIWRAHIYKV